MHYHLHTDRDTMRRTGYTRFAKQHGVAFASAAARGAQAYIMHIDTSSIVD